MAFVNRVADAADHHSNIDIRYSEVTFTPSTNDAGGLTSRNTVLAARADEFEGSAG